jgi:hypothetical protein
MMQASYRNVKVDRYFIPSGTTQNSFDIRVVKRLQDQLELSADLQQEWWKAPIYQAGEQNDTVVTFQLTLHPEHPAAH